MISSKNNYPRVYPLIPEEALPLLNVIYLGAIRGWIVFPKNICWSPNLQCLWKWTYLVIGIFQMQLKISLHWIKVGSYKDGKIWKHRDTHPEGRRLCENSRGNWSNAAASQETPRFASNHQKLGKKHGTDSLSQPSQRTLPHHQLGFRLLVSRPVRGFLLL